MGSNFKILFVIAVMTWQCYVLILAILLLFAVKGLDYRSIIHGISKSGAFCLLQNSVLGDCGYVWNTYQRNQY